MTKKEMADAHVSRMEKLHDPIALANMPAIIMTDSFCAGYDAGVESQSQENCLNKKCPMYDELLQHQKNETLDRMQIFGDLRAKLKLAVEALEFYAKNTREAIDYEGCDPECIGDYNVDTGDKARTTLAKIGETHE